MIVFLKSLLFIFWNVLIGTSIILLLRWLLFNLRSRFVFGLHIPLTPGFIVAKRDWLFNKVRAILHDYLEQADRISDNFGYLSKWEKLVFEAVYAKLTTEVEDWKFIPRVWEEKIKSSIARAAEEIVRKILRKTIPKLIEQLQIENRIDDFDEKFNSRFLRQYYNQYVHKYLLYLFVAVNFLIGITNMILYWLIA